MPLARCDCLDVETGLLGWFVFEGSILAVKEITMNIGELWSVGTASSQCQRQRELHPSVAAVDALAATVDASAAAVDHRSSTE